MKPKRMFDEPELEKDKIRFKEPALEKAYQRVLRKGIFEKLKKIRVEPGVT